MQHDQLGCLPSTGWKAARRDHPSGTLIARILDTLYPSRISQVKHSTPERPKWPELRAGTRGHLPSTFSLHPSTNTINIHHGWVVHRDKISLSLTRLTDGQAGSDCGVGKRIIGGHSSSKSCRKSRLRGPGKWCKRDTIHNPQYQFPPIYIPTNPFNQSISQVSPTSTIHDPHPIRAGHIDSFN